ncbi:hypothetical protein AOLI_G00136370 [Acnodon oligacanthus]
MRRRRSAVLIRVPVVFLLVLLLPCSCCLTGCSRTGTGEAATDKPIRASPELQSGEVGATKEMTGLLFRIKLLCLRSSPEEALRANTLQENRELLKDMGPFGQFGPWRVQIGEPSVPSAGWTQKKKKT